MSQEQNDWEKERQEREFKRWRWETARKIVLQYMMVYKPSRDETSQDAVIRNSVALTDKLISALQRSQP